MKTLLVAINAKYIHSNPAVYSLKAYAGDKSIEICEYTINNLIDDIIDDIYIRKPEFIGFSTYIWNVEFVLKAASQLKKLLPGCYIWLGGPEVSYNAKEVLLDNFFIDGIMCGEGEKTFKKLYEYYTLGKGSLSDISGIAYRDNGTRENPMANPMDMSEIPFLYEDVFSDDTDDFANRIIYYESSRGCPFSCSYCLSSVDKSVRFRDISLVLKELKVFIDKKVKQVKFVDRTFNCKKSHSMEILRFIGENDNGVTNFHFEIAADLLDEEELKLIKTFRPGLIQLEIGIQSVNEMTITEIKRKMDLSKVRQVMTSLNEGKNVLCHLDIIAGLPFEDLESFKNSFNETYMMKPAELQLGFLKVLSGSYMKEKHKDYGIVYRDYPPYEVLYTKWISHDELLELKGVEEMVEVYYNSMQFQVSVAYMERFFETPYEMYFLLSKYYEKTYPEKGRKYTRLDRYNILYEFFKEKCEDKDEIYKFSELLTFDLYLRENAKKRPSFARDLSEVKEVLYERYREIEKNDEYKGKMIHIEKFNVDVLGFYRGTKESPDARENYVVFDYSNRNTIDNSADARETD